MDAIELASKVTARLPAPLGTRIGYRLGERASRKTRLAKLRTGGRVAADVGDHLHRHMFFRGEYEPGVTALMRRLATPGWQVVDVGANVGYFSVLAADLGGVGTRVIAFEPHPVLGDMLATTAAANPASQIIVERAAAGSQPGTATLYVSPEDRNSGLGTLRPDLHSTEGVEVPVVRVDDVCERHQLRPDLVKIDAEGFEREVLAGCSGLLEQRSPAHFLIELSPYRDDPTIVIEFMADRGYTGHQIGPDGSLRTLDTLDPVYEDVCFVRLD